MPAGVHSCAMLTNQEVQRREKIQATSMGVKTALLCRRFVYVCASALHVVLPPQPQDSCSAGIMMLQEYLSVPVRHTASLEG